MGNEDWVLYCTRAGCLRPGYHLGAFESADPHFPVEVEYSCGHRVAYTQMGFDAMVEQAIASDALGPSRRRILEAITGGGEISFGQFCSNLKPDCPRAGEDRDLWAALFKKLEAAARDGLVVIAREQDGADHIKWLRLTETGAEMVRGRLDSSRGLLELMK